MKKKQILVLIVSIIGLLLIAGGVTYAYLRNTKTQSGTNQLSTLTCLSVTMENLSNAITLTNAVPITDNQGLQLTPYRFKITNNCNSKTLTEINLESLAVENGIDLTALSASLDGETPSIVGSLTNGSITTISGATSKNLKTFILDRNDEITFELRLWVSNTATYDDAFNKSYQGKIVVLSSYTDLDCMTKPNGWSNATNGTILASLNGNCYSKTISTPGRQKSYSFEKVLASTPDDYGESLYFRGSVDNNYVVFANMCWRIVRVTGDDGTSGDYNNAVKLVLYNYNNGNIANPCNQAGTSYAFARFNNTTYKTAYNTSYNRNAYVGFMYGSASGSTYAATHANTTDSTILTNLKKWYDGVLTIPDKNQLADVIWCNDKRFGSTNTGTGITTSSTNYASRDRTYPASTATPSLKCGDGYEDNKVSKFTASEDHWGNAKLKGVNGTGTLEYKVGLLTGDELEFAGNGYSEVDTNYYLYANSTDSNWWTMSPNVGGSSSTVRNVTTTGILNATRVSTNSLGLRPAVALKSTTQVTGTGTATDPYRVQNISSTLPSGYQQVEYIQSSGAQYIDTGVNGESGLEVAAQVLFTAVPNDGAFLGAKDDTNRIYLIYSYPAKWAMGFGSYYSSSTAITANKKYSVLTKLSNGKQTVTVNNVIVYTNTLASDYNTNKNMYLFALNNNGSPSNYVSGRIYSMQIYANGALERNFVPCTRTSDDKPGLYDIVHNVFYPNLGAGADFTVGANV